MWGLGEHKDPRVEKTKHSEMHKVTKAQIERKENNQTVHISSPCLMFAWAVVTIHGVTVAYPDDAS
jgi:hypothetical protein